MHPSVLALIMLAIIPIQLFSQGSFCACNPTAPTRLGATDGPFGGTNLLGQFLVGTNIDSLSPVGTPYRHVNGYVNGGRVTVLGIDGGTYAWVQFVAWDRGLWGETLDGLPADQLGRTDIVSLYFSYSFQPVFAPPFSESAIVPIPEPSAWALLALCAAGFWFVRRRRR